MHPVVSQNLALFDQLDSLLMTLSDAEYAAPLQAFDDHSIGQHVRHILDFYGAVIRRKADNAVNYDARARDESIAAHRSVARDLLLDLRAEVCDCDPATPIVAISNGCGDLGSTLARELAFAHDHAVHHLALIKVGLRVHLPQLELGAAFGVAPSTLQHRKG